MIANLTEIQYSLKALKYAYDNRKVLYDYFDMLRIRLEKGEVKICILGEGGVGKSTLGRFLTGQDLPKAYKQSYELETHALQNSLMGKIVVAPGQDDYKNQWLALKQEIMSGEIDCVFHCVSYGYHSLKTEITNDIIDIYGGKRAFLHNYLSQMRDKELKNFKVEIMPFLSDSPKPLYLFTIILKQDLWWQERKEVMHHYNFGEYHSLIKLIEEKKGKNNFHHRLLPLSLQFENFNPTGEHIAKKTAKGYDNAYKDIGLNALKDLFAEYEVYKKR